MAHVIKYYHAVMTRRQLNRGLVGRDIVNGTLYGTIASHTVASTQKTLLVDRHGTEIVGRH